MKNDAVSQKEWNESNDMREQATVWESSKRWKEENEAKCPKIINALKVRSPGFIHRDEGFRNAPHFEEEKKTKKTHVSCFGKTNGATLWWKWKPHVVKWLRLKDAIVTRRRIFKECALKYEQ